MKFNIGDIVLSDVYVGVVTKPGDDVVMCNCSDGQSHRFANDNTQLITPYQTMLHSFREGILSNAGR